MSKEILFGGLNDPEAADMREMYAYFGLAVYACQHVEQSLIIITLLIEKDKNLIGSDHSYDERSDELGQKTLGQLIKEVSSQIELQSDLKDSLMEALRIRNLLMHRFYVVNSVGHGRRDVAGMIEELDRYGNFLFNLDRRLVDIYERLMKKTGMSLEDMVSALEHLVSREELDGSMPEFFRQARK